MASKFNKEDKEISKGPPAEESTTDKWRLTFGRERYPTLPRVVRRSSESPSDVKNPGTGPVEK